MTNLKFQFILAFMIGLCGILNAQCTNMDIVESPLGADNQVVYEINLEFDDSGSKYLEVYKDGLDSKSKRCTESPCTVRYYYTKKATVKEKEIVCYSSKCDSYARCIVTIDDL